MQFQRLADGDDDPPAAAKGAARANGDASPSAAAGSPSADVSYAFAADAVTRAAGCNLATLNAPPSTHAEAMAQLRVAKAYIARAQAMHTAAASPVSHGKRYGAAEESSAAVSPLKGSDVDVKLTHVAVRRSSDAEDADDAQQAPLEHTSHPRPQVGPPPEITPDQYYDTPWWRLLLKRLPWLVILLLCQSFGALILYHYDDLMAEHLVLNFFIPMMQGTSGNAGNQPGVMVTRAMSMGKLRLNALLRKEAPVAFITALTLGFTAYVRIRLVYMDEPGSAFAISMALFCSVLLAVALSIAFSIFLSKITCCDPADGAVPLLSTVNDVISILLLVIIAKQVLPTKNDH